MRKDNRGAHNFINLVGAKFGRWTVLSRSENAGSKIMWLCRCSCGAQKAVRAGSLTRGRSTSCGCWQRELATKSSTTHNGSSTPEFMVWKSMLGRCSNPNCKDWKNYGGRGIFVCDRWRAGFQNFLDDMGRRPSNEFSIDRVDVNGNYEPGNCRWATAKEQVDNRRPKSEWASAHNL